ncbi:hypothetical protein H4582DRAFT_2054226 [Lactarius indigo]|nr:hypothetical protein H4582DRAFT_2054226 [Lactarius indigo]
MTLLLLNTDSAIVRRWKPSCIISRPTCANFGTLDGCGTDDWATFKSNLESLYPDLSAANYTKRALQEFVDISSKTRMRDEDDVMIYYRPFLTHSNPLSNKQRISDEERSLEFFRGFHSDDRELMFRLSAMKPDHLVGLPYDLEDVLATARRQFSGVQLSDFPSREFRHGPINLRESYHADPDQYQWMRRLSGREDRDPRLRQECMSQYSRDSTDDCDSWSDDSPSVNATRHVIVTSKTVRYEIRTILTDDGPGYKYPPPRSTKPPLQPAPNPLPPHTNLRPSLPPLS